MAMTKEAKKQLKVKVAEKLVKVNAAIVAEYRGLTVGELTELRVKLREAKAEFRIIKNRIAKVAMKEDAPALGPIIDAMKGPVGLILVFGDPAPAAKALNEFGKDRENFKVTKGVFEGAALSPAQLKEIADLPSREVMLGQIAGMIQSPAQRVLNLAVAIPRQVIQMIVALSEKKQ
jgi:large subunit ribosomal protein L10